MYMRLFQDTMVANRDRNFLSRQNRTYILYGPPCLDCVSYETRTRKYIIIIYFAIKTEQF